MSSRAGKCRVETGEVKTEGEEQEETILTAQSLSSGHQAASEKELTNTMSSQHRALRQGSFGKVCTGTYNGQTAAFKTVPAIHINKYQLERECQAYRQLNHKNIVKLLGEPFKYGDKWYFPLEYISGSTLEVLMFKHDMMTDEKKVIIIHGMCDGLHYLHMKNIVHQDLKPDNIMIEFGTNRAVIDYTASARAISSGKNFRNSAYCAPEVQEGAMHSRKSDVWAMGKIIAELILGQRLFCAKCTLHNVKTVVSGTVFDEPVSRMLHQDKNQRVDMSDVIEIIKGIQSIISNLRTARKVFSYVGAVTADALSYAGTASTLSSAGVTIAGTLSSTGAASALSYAGAATASALSSAGVATAGALSSAGVATAGVLSSAGVTAAGALSSMGVAATGVLSSAGVATAGALSSAGVATAGALSSAGVAAAGALSSAGVAGALSSVGVAATGALSSAGVAAASMLSSAGAAAGVLSSTGAAAAGAFSSMGAAAGVFSSGGAAAASTFPIAAAAVGALPIAAVAAAAAVGAGAVAALLRR